MSPNQNLNFNPNLNPNSYPINIRDEAEDSDNDIPDLEDFDNDIPDLIEIVPNPNPNQQNNNMFPYQRFVQQNIRSDNEQINQAYFNLPYAITHFNPNPNPINLPYAITHFGPNPNRIYLSDLIDIGDEDEDVDEDEDDDDLPDLIDMDSNPNLNMLFTQ